MPPPPQNRKNNPYQQQQQRKKPTYDANGKRVNDYIPNFIASKPWYYESEALSVDSNSRKRKSEEEIAEELAKTDDRLKHQRLKPGAEIVANNEPRKGLGITDEFEVIKDEKLRNKRLKNNKSEFGNGNKLKFKKGACENCGSLKHQKRDCLEKPRKVSYFYRETTDDDKEQGGDNEQTDDDEVYVRKNTGDWDDKRDRWHGYDSIKDYDKQLKIMKKKEMERQEAIKKQQELLEDLDEDERAEMQELGLLNTGDDSIKTSTAMAATIAANSLNNPLAAKEGGQISVRSLDEKARYLEVIKTGEELRFNPKSRVYKDLKEGYLNDRGQFVRYINGEAEEFEKLKIFASSKHEENKLKYMEDTASGNDRPLTDLSYAAEVSPTGLMLAMKEKEEKDQLLREAKRKELLEKYGAIGGQK